MKRNTLIPLEWYVETSIQFIKKHEPPEGYYVGFSGGKDSIVTLELTKMSGVKFTAYYSATGIDPPEAIQFIRKHYPEVKWLYPKYSFWDGIKNKCPPLRISRWCCDVLKKEPSSKIPLNHRIMGIRGEESSKRRKRGQISHHKKTKQTIYCPIFYWLEWHVWEFIDKYELPYPSLYDEGFHRIGCVVCPFLSGANLRQHKLRYPKYYKIFEKSVKYWWDNKGKHNINKEPGKLGFTTADEYLQWWYNDKTACVCPSDDCAGIGSFVPFKREMVK
jgi:phosphoadenosine phosphosulfate reductase